jgi:hypothetical protein
MPQTLVVTALLVAACSSGPSLEKTEELAPKTIASSPEDADACRISITGADRNGVRLPKASVKAVKAELKERRIDCSAYANSTAGESRAQTAGSAISHPISFDDGRSQRPEQTRQSAD